MPTFSQRMFGSDIDETIKLKLLARQALAEDTKGGMVAPGQSIQIKTLQGTKTVSFMTFITVEL